MICNEQPSNLSGLKCTRYHGWVTFYMGQQRGLGSLKSYKDPGWQWLHLEIRFYSLWGRGRENQPSDLALSFYLKVMHGISTNIYWTKQVVCLCVTSKGRDILACNWEERRVISVSSCSNLLQGAWDTKRGSDLSKLSRLVCFRSPLLCRTYILPSIQTGGVRGHGWWKDCN